MLDKLDKTWIGIIAGAFLPAFFFVCYWLFFYSQLSFPKGFIKYLQNGEMLQEIAIACIVANVIMFYVLLNKKVYSLVRGIIIASFLYVGLVLYISLL